MTFTGSTVREYTCPGEPALDMPTDVAVGRDGTVAIADGVNHRIVCFAPGSTSPTVIAKVGELELADPLGLAFDSAGRLWIAEADKRQVVVRGTNGQLERTIVIEFANQGRPFNPTDVVPLDGGRRAWIVDNDSHRVVQWDAAVPPSEYVAVGKQGSALGQFHYPFMIAADDAGHAFVTDTLNGRVQGIDTSGKPTGIIGSYGVQPGQLYRPKGVAVDAEGNVWVADSVSGVVQSFSRTGPQRGVLRDTNDEPLKFAAPAGISFGPQGHLYVTELLGHRVREVEIASQPRAAELPRPGRAQVAGAAGQSPACTICHIEWMPDLADRNSSALVALPEHGPDQPVVSRAETCLSCHDGSVVDSRRRVWREHGHRTGVVPPTGMKVPDYLPLVDNKLACRTCHSAHAGGHQNQSLADAVFVRVENGAGELCMSCHADKAMGPAAGAHPVGGMPWAVPDKLIAEGAKVGPNPRELTCYVCHRPHGSKEQHLLVMGTESSQLCLTCHEKLRPGLWRPDSEKEHPQNPPLQTEAQKKAVHDMGTSTGTGGTLICLSCHRVHHGVSDRYLLADTLKESRLCLRCHPERAEMKGTSHDLRVSSPECRNRIGQNADASGPCGACHTFHRFARMPDPQPHDPTGLCVSCHQADACANRVKMLAPGHPSQVKAEQLPNDLGLHVFPQADGSNDKKTIACLTCHDPHKASEKFFLRMPQEQLCANCHRGVATSLSGGHELTGLEIRNADGRTPAEAGKCGFCHTMHEAKGPRLWAATDQAPATADGLCTACHREGGLAARLPETQLHHPTGPDTAEAAAKLTTNLPLFGQSEGNPGGYVACGSCHDPHGNAKTAPALLRAGPKVTELCVQCHTDNAAMSGGLHDVNHRPNGWPESAQKAEDTCVSCHRSHSNDPASGLWAVPPAGAYAESDGVCLGCHQHVEWSGHGTRPAQPGATTQPAATSQPAPTIHGLPLVPTEPGRRSGAVGCKTCHNPHAAPDQPHLLRTTASHDPGAMCLACHTELKYIGMSMHSREAMKGFTAQVQGQKGGMTQCGPCHNIHAAEQATQTLPGKLGQLPKDMQRCVACHRPEGGATAVHVIQHWGPLQNVNEPGTPGFMPLVNDQGEFGRAGHIGCVTCHTPHGRPPSPGFQVTDPAKVTGEQLKAMMPMVAPYTAPNLCSSCHGFDGLMRYLYWHNPERRGGKQG